MSSEAAAEAASRAGNFPGEQATFLHYRPEAKPTTRPKKTLPSTGSTMSPSCATWASMDIRAFSDMQRGTKGGMLESPKLGSQFMRSVVS